MPTNTIFVDIDGTLTDDPWHAWGEPREDMIARVKAMIESGIEIVVWSAGGTDYAREFAERYGIRPMACIGKPSVAVDDSPSIRTGGIRVVSPEDFLGLGKG